MILALARSLYQYKGKPRASGDDPYPSDGDWRGRL